jgi:hypothetical protein
MFSRKGERRIGGPMVVVRRTPPVVDRFCGSDLVTHNIADPACVREQNWRSDGNGLSSRAGISRLKDRKYLHPITKNAAAKSATGRNPF